MRQFRIKLVTPLSQSEIEVFVRSKSREIDIDHYREMSYHVQCGLARHAYEELASQFRGRILAEEDYEALNKIFALAKEENCDVRVYDTSRTADRVKALKRGIFRTPVVIIKDVKYQGLEEIAQAATIKLKR